MIHFSLREIMCCGSIGDVIVFLRGDYYAKVGSYEFENRAEN